METMGKIFKGREKRGRERQREGETGRVREA